MLKSLLENPDVQSILVDAIATLGGALSLLLARLLYRLFAAAGVQLDDADKRLVLDLARAGASYAEEYGKAKIKGGEVAGGDEKRLIAIDAVRQLAGGRLTKWTDEQLATAVEAHLPEMRARLSVAPPARVAAPIAGGLPPVAAELARYTRPR